MSTGSARVGFALLVVCLSCGGRTRDGDGGREGAAGDPDADPDLVLNVDDEEAAPVAPGSDFDVCTGVAEEPENTFTPADIIFLIDNSPSMRDEILWTRENMNEFTGSLAERGLDPRIVVISCLQDGCDGHPSTTGICIDPPVGSGDCTTSDTNLPGYLHVDQRMPSQKLLERAVDTYSEWQSIRRPEAVTHFVAISDDGELTSADDFRSALAAQDPPLESFVFHGIFSSQGKEDACLVSSSEPCCTYAAPDGEGVEYRDLVEMTGGVAADLCAQDFDPVFVQFAESVVAHAELNCEWTIPPPPDGQEIDPNLINVQFNSAGESTNFGYVSSPKDCGELDNAWYYDDPAAPRHVAVCPATCERIRQAPQPSLTITFGCSTVDVESVR